MIASSTVLKDLQVLVVEDQYYVAAEMKRLIVQLGGRVLGPARDVDSALKVLEDGVRPDLAVLDVNLNGVRVYALADTLLSKDIGFIFATGYESWAIDARFADAPVVLKPVTAGPFIAAVTKIRARLGRDQETG